MTDKFTGGGLDSLTKAAYEEGYKAGAAAEREECATVCDEVEKRKWLTVQNGGRLDGVGARDCAAAIRARGEK